MSCIVEVGYVCTGGTPASKDTCTKLCGNSVINIGEECDNGINNAASGCLNCIIQPGWDCVGAVCT